jgi:hypothetical protein
MGPQAHRGQLEIELDRVQAYLIIQKYIPGRRGIVLVFDHGVWNRKMKVVADRSFLAELSRFLRIVLLTI